MREKKKNKGKDLTPKAVGLATKFIRTHETKLQYQIRDAAMLTDSTVKIDMRVMPELPLKLGLRPML